VGPGKEGDARFSSPAGGKRKKKKKEGKVAQWFRGHWSKKLKRDVTMAEDKEKERGKKGAPVPRRNWKKKKKKGPTNHRKRPSERREKRKNQTGYLETVKEEKKGKEGEGRVGDKALQVKTPRRGEKRSPRGGDAVIRMRGV